jgi:hypothetical protein
MPLLETLFCMLFISYCHGVTERCLSWLTNSAFVLEPKCGGGVGCGVSANEYSSAH